jgi:hypothetical protein
MRRAVAMITGPPGGAVIVFLASFAWLAAISPWIGIYQINPDEGLNLGKAALVAAGYGPYGEIWNDQPPMLTFLLAGLHVFCPGDVGAARLAVVATAAILLACLYAAAHRKGGGLAAAIAVVFLATTPFFIQLSSAVLIGLTAISLAMLALVAGDARSPRAAARAVLSGLIFGLSLQTKLFTFTMIPAVLATVAFCSGLTRSTMLRLATIWAVACAAAFALVVLVSGQDPVGNLIATHITPTLRAQYEILASQRVIWSTLAQAPAVTIAGLLGLLLLPVVTAHARRIYLVPALWCGTAFLVLALHQPVQPHQVLLLIVPLAWLGGLFVAELPRLVAAAAGFAPQIATAASALAAIVAAANGIAALPARTAVAALTPLALAADGIATYAALGGWVVADLPIAAFRNGLLVPPELVVISEKRRTNGNLTDEQVAMAIERRRPTQVVFQRFPALTVLEARLADDYVAAHRGVSELPYVHYVRREPPVGLDGAALRRRLAKRVAAMTATAAADGYAPAVDLTTGDRFGEGKARLASDEIWMRPPGATYAIGQRFLHAYGATSEDGYRALAVATALAVARSQTCRGGWQAASASRGSCTVNDPGTAESEDFDEGMQAGAIAFMLDVASAIPDSPERRELIGAAGDGLAFLIETQNEDGAWPIAPFVTSEYRALSTLNDDVSTANVRILLKAHRALGNPEYLEAARRGYAFLIAAQLPSGGWAQQYDHDLGPAQGRKFEPPAAASIETAYAIRTLVEGYHELGDPRLLSTAKRGADWLAASQTEPETWARFYEIDSNRPIFGDRDGSVHYALGKISEERRNNYDWLGRFPAVLDAIRLARGAEKGRAFYMAETSAMAEAKRLALLAALATRRSSERGLLVAADWMAAVDGLLAAIEVTGRRAREPSPSGEAATGALPR